MHDIIMVYYDDIIIVYYDDISSVYCDDIIMEMSAEQNGSRGHFLFNVFRTVGPFWPFEIAKNGPEYQLLIPHLFF